MPKPAVVVDMSLVRMHDHFREVQLTKRRTQNIRSPGRNCSWWTQRNRTLRCGQCGGRQQAEQAQRKTVHYK